ncbi:unnamed protein product [Durusdinium trenchii]|uniref:Uncharacterized protein n=1 Tax=Durusdinium trenchii TaxID=1381693 RepID=A0ABP0Q6Z3_9DINO
MEEELPSLVEAIVLEPALRATESQASALGLYAARLEAPRAAKPPARLDEVITFSLASGSSAQRALLQLAAALLSLHGVSPGRLVFRRGGFPGAEDRGLQTADRRTPPGVPSKSVMSFASLPSQTMAPISRLMALVWGNKEVMQKDSKAVLTKDEKQLKVESKIETNKRQKEVRIDATTMVPTDLYWSLLRAGERARSVGQHRLKTASRQSSNEPHLVRS